mgnify:CR=1 FL=1
MVQGESKPCQIRGCSNGYSTSINRLTNAIFELKDFKAISWYASIDLVSEALVGFPRDLNSRESPNNQIVLHRSSGGS